MNQLSIGTPIDRTYVEKLTAKEEIAEIKSLMEKELLTETEMNRLSILISGVEQKLVNYGDTTRYYSGKYVTWIQDVFTIAIMNLRNSKIVRKKEQTSITLEAQDQITRILDRLPKEMINIFLFFNRSSLSLGAMGFEALTKQRIEQEYYARGFPGSQPEKQSSNTFVFRGRQA